MKMANQFKKKNTAGGGLYIALAICVLSVICIGVYSAVISIFDTSSLTNTEKAPGESKTPTIIVETPGSTKSGNAAKEPQIKVEAEAPGEIPEQSVANEPEPPSYTLPVAGDVTKPFSHDVLVYSETMNDYRVHNGTDLYAAVGSPVKAFTDGVVEEVFEDPLMGYTMVLTHANDVKSVYRNLSEQFPEGISVGAPVKEGQVIAGVGESNLVECAEEPHLHFEVTVGGEYVDPMSFFQ